jgi:hypothetical protein
MPTGGYDDDEAVGSDDDEALGNTVFKHSVDGVRGVS